MSESLPHYDSSFRLQRVCVTLCVCCAYASRAHRGSCHGGHVGRGHAHVYMRQQLELEFNLQMSEATRQRAL